MALIQSFITIGVVALLWSLHARLVDRAVFRYWTWAWTTFGVYLVICALVSLVPSDSATVRLVLRLAVAIAGVLTMVLLVFGALSVKSESSLPIRWLQAGIGAAIAGGVLLVFVSHLWPDRFDSLYVRLAVSRLLLGGALSFCAWVFLAAWRQTQSTANEITGAVCVCFAVLQLGAGSAFVLNLSGIASPLAEPVVALWHELLWLDVANLYAACLGLVLLFVEDYERSQRALRESQDRREQVASENLTLQAEILVRRQAEQALQRSEEKFAAAFHSNPCAMGITRLDTGCIVDVNAIMVSQSGYTRDELIGRNADDLGFWVDPAERAAVRAELESSGRVTTREVQWRAGGGRFVTVLYSADTIDVDGRRCVLSVAEDVTAQRQAEAQHRAVLRALPDWIFVLSADGVFLDFHVKDPERLAVPSAHFIGRHITDVLPPEIGRALVDRFTHAMKTDETATFEYSLPSEGELRHFEARIVRCDTDKVLSIVRDVTERRQAERQARELRDELAHVGRVTTLATLTGSLAHEINQPLAAVMTNAQAARRLMAAPVPDLDELRAALADIVSDNHRAAEVVRRLRSLLRKDASELAPVDLNESIAEVVSIMRNDAVARRIALEVTLAADLPQVLGDRVQLQQVALNLLMNAFEALDRENPANRRVELTTAADGGLVTVSVLDGGVGLTDDELAQVFEPFYTTKPDGMGLGLAICQTIMSAHDGAVGAERCPAGGTLFWFSLPVLEAAQAAAAPPAVIHQNSRRTVRLTVG